MDQVCLRNPSNKFKIGQISVQCQITKFRSRSLIPLHENKRELLSTETEVLLLEKRPSCSSIDEVDTEDLAVLCLEVGSGVMGKVNSTPSSLAAPSVCRLIIGLLCLRPEHTLDLFLVTAMVGWSIGKI